MSPLLLWPTLLSHSALIRSAFTTLSQSHLKGICLLLHMLQNQGAEEEQQNTRREGTACWGVVWEIDDSAKYILMVIPLHVINCRDKLTPMPRGSRKLSPKGQTQRLWKSMHLLPVTSMILKWPWHNFFCFLSFLCYFPSAAMFYSLKYAVNYGNQLQKSDSFRNPYYVLPDNPSVQISLKTGI